MPLPPRANLRHLRDQARDLVRSGAAPNLAAAFLQIARQYDFPSWPKLKHQLVSRDAAGQLERAITDNDVALVERLLAGSAELRALLPEEHSLPANGERIPMMEVLYRYGVSVDAMCWGWFPTIFFPCENLDPVALKWLLDHGADPNISSPRGKPATALDYVIQTYPRDPTSLTACIDLLLAAGGRTRYDLPGVLPILRGRTDELATLLDADPGLVHRRFAELDCGASGGRLMLLSGGTLLHVAAEYGFLDAARLLLDRGSDVNARADIDAKGMGGQTPIFHALTHFMGANPEVAQHLIERGADLSMRARVPGHYEREGEMLEVSASEYNKLFPLR